MWEFLCVAVGLLGGGFPDVRQGYTSALGETPLVPDKFRTVFR